MILFGPVGAGKTTFIQTLIDDQYCNDVSIGSNKVWLDFVHKDITNDDDISVRLQIWDNYYFNRFRHISAAYIRGAQAILLCFAIDSRSSFVQLMELTLSQCHHLRELTTQVQLYLVGLKSDMDQNRAISKEEAKMVASELHMKYFEVSCKQYPRGNLNEMLQEIGDDALARMTWNLQHKDDESSQAKPASPKLSSRPDRPRYTASAIIIVSVLVSFVAIIIAILKVDR